MQRTCLPISLMLQLGVRSNCKSRINTYSEKGNSASQSTPQSIEEGNWFKDETQSCLPMWSPVSPLLYSPSNLLQPYCSTFDLNFHKNRECDTTLFFFFFPTVLAMLVKRAQSQILGCDCKWWLDINHTWIAALRCQPLKYSRAPGIHMRWLEVSNAVWHNWITWCKGVQLNV